MSQPIPYFSDYYLQRIKDKKLFNKLCISYIFLLHHTKGGKKIKKEFNKIIINYLTKFYDNPKIIKLSNYCVEFETTEKLTFEYYKIQEIYELITNYYDGVITDF